MQKFHHFAVFFILITPLSFSIFDEHFQLFQTLKFQSNKTSLRYGQSFTETVNIAIFLKDTESHGANLRLTRFACNFMKSPLSNIHIEVFTPIADSSNFLVNELTSCHVPMTSVSMLTLNDIKDKMAKQNDNSKNIEIEINVTLLNILQKIDVVVVVNTLGDIQTDTLFSYIQIVKSSRHMMRQDHQSRLKPLLLMDLCNLPEFAVEYKDKWLSLIDGYIAPSLYTAFHPSTRLLTDKITVVYPSISFQQMEYLASLHAGITAITGDLSPSSTASSLHYTTTWPRRWNDTFRIGCIGRVSYERSPGICMRTFAYIYQHFYDIYTDMNFLFVFVGDGNLLDDIKILGRKLGIQDIVEYWGHQENVLQSLHLLDIAINAKVQGESFGIMNAEAMLSRTPVIAFNRSANQESLHPLARVLLEDVNISNFAETIVDVAVNPTKYGINSSSLDIASRETLFSVHPLKQTRKMINAILEHYLTL